MASKRKCLTLSQKIEILKIYDEQKLSCREIAKRFGEKFGAGKTRLRLHFEKVAASALGSKQTTITSFF